MNRKGGDISPIYFVIIGILLFIIVSCSIGGGIMNALSGYKNAEASAESLISAMETVSNVDNKLSNKLVLLDVEEGSAIYIFNGNSNLTEQVKNGDEMERRVIKRPMECSANNSATCLCLCTDFSIITTDSTPAVYTTPLPMKVHNLKCDELQCRVLENVTFESRIPLSEIVEEAEVDRIIQGENHVEVWEGGFSIWRAEDKTDEYMPDQFFKTKLSDVFVVKMFGNKVKLCLHQQCRTNA